MKRFGDILRVEELKSIDEDQLACKLENYIKELDLEVGKSQKKSWLECVRYLKNTFKNTGKYDDLYIVFEYWIPLSCYRRPDVILLYKNMVLVLEFKRKNISLEADKSQLRGYLNELRNYHDVSHKRKLDIKGALVVTESEEKIYIDNGIDIIEGKGLIKYLEKINLEPMCEKLAIEWLKSEYMPLLDIINATSNMFLNGEISHIKNIEDGEIKVTQDFILNQIKDNQNKKKIFFLTGVPGAGKTLVLLNILYSLNSISKGEGLKSIFTSGNGPLISTLSYILSKDKNILDGEAFIKEIKNIKGSLYNKYKDCPNDNVNFYETILFDESQRSWDFKHMEQYNFKVSEPELLLKIQNKAFEECGKTNLICSYGEGQSIYLGEESGFEIWSEVLNREEYKDWEIYCSQELSKYFRGRDNTIIVDDLFIDTSIRGNFIDVNPFIKAVLDVDVDNAECELEKIYSSGFDIKISRDFNKIKKYLREYENECSDSFYGLITSSNASTYTLEHTIPGFKKVLSQKDNLRIGKWYVEKSSKLEEAAAEFGCQGLELNIPIVVFGRDYIIKDGKWQVSDNVIKKAKVDKSYYKVLKYNDKDEIFRNIYRVLLSRGRKGIILFIPDGCSDLNETYEFFETIGKKYTLGL